MKPKLSFALGGFFKGDDDDDEGGADDDDIGAGPLDLAKSGSLKKSPFLNGKNYGNDKMTTTTSMMRMQIMMILTLFVWLLHELRW